MNEPEQPTGGPVNCSVSELSIYLQGLAAGFLATSCLDTTPSAPWNLTPIASKSYTPASKRGCFPGFPSLRMSGNLTGTPGVDSLTLCAAASPARTSAPRAPAPDWTEPDPACGGKWRAWFAKWDPASSSWKTPQCSLLAGLDEFSETWPSWGTMRAGAAYPLDVLARPTRGTDSGSWPTPTATDYKGGTAAIRKDTGKVRLDLVRHVCKVRFGLTYPIPEHSEALMGWPIGWSDLKPLGTDRFRTAWLLPGKRFVEGLNDHP